MYCGESGVISNKIAEITTFKSDFLKYIKLKHRGITQMKKCVHKISSSACNPVLGYEFFYNFGEKRG